MRQMEKTKSYPYQVKTRRKGAGCAHTWWERRLSFAFLAASTLKEMALRGPPPGAE